MSLNVMQRSKPERLASTCHQLVRAYTGSAARLAEAQKSPAPTPNPHTAATLKEVALLRKAGLNPIGSRRRRAAIKASQGIPFEHLPYQCFQEARKVLAEDRVEKLKKIATEKVRIANLEAKDTTATGGEAAKHAKLKAMRRHLELLKIQADINDPLVKKRWEDGLGDMNKPIYRHLSDRKWRSYNRKITMQRIETMSVVPDVLPHINPTVEVKAGFRQRDVKPGDFVPSVMSTIPPMLRVQAFDKGPRYYTVVVVDPDVPDLASDSFTSRCHFLATNIRVDPASPLVPLMKLAKDNQHVVVDWLPPTAQKGAPYHRLCTFVLEQPGRVDPFALGPNAAAKEGEGAGTSRDEQVMGRLMDAQEMRTGIRRDGFWMRWFCAKYGMRPVGFHMFRAIWDDWTAEVMRRHGIPGADVEFSNKRGEKLPPKKRDTDKYR